MEKYLNLKYKTLNKYKDIKLHGQLRELPEDSIGHA